MAEGILSVVSCMLFSSVTDSARKVERIKPSVKGKSKRLRNTVSNVVLLSQSLRISSAYKEQCYNFELPSGELTHLLIVFQTHVEYWHESRTSIVNYNDLECGNRVTFIRIIVTFTKGDIWKNHESPQYNLKAVNIKLVRPEYKSAALPLYHPVRLVLPSLMQEPVCSLCI
jgi:hypothetical protein